jgi:hypothetical protein
MLLNVVVRVGEGMVNVSRSLANRFLFCRHGHSRRDGFKQRRNTCYCPSICLCEQCGIHLRFLRGAILASTDRALQHLFFNAAPFICLNERRGHAASV